MKRTLRFDSVGGASGDMILAALIDLGASVDTITTHLKGLAIDAFSIEVTPYSTHGMHGSRVDVRIPKQEHVHRHLADIRAILASAPLPGNAASMAGRVFDRLAEAEAHVHNTTPDAIHFHEVGAVDAIVDIVGTCVALELLGIDEILVAPLPVGSGTVHCAHGLLPAPVPATVELLKDWAVLQTTEPFELITPTGAALLSTLGHPLSALSAPAVVRQRGHGFGSRDLADRPNLLRASLLEAQEAAAPHRDTCLVLETNVDDTVPELVGALTTTLIAQGALDTFTTPVQMKKQRPAALLTVLCRQEDREKMLDLIFAETTTFGVREYPVERTLLERRHEAVDTPYGQIRIKIGTWKGRALTHSPEHDDCIRAAQAASVPLRAVYEAAMDAWRRQHHASSPTA